MKIAVLMATFNRVAVTVRGLEAFFASARRQELAVFEIFLLDDASPDGTAATVRATFPEIHVLDGTGNLWWNRGMCAAYRAARQSGIAFDAYLLLNDDVILKPEALGDLVETFTALNRQAPAALTGSMCGPDQRPSYPGLSRNPAHRPLRRPMAPKLLMQVIPDGSVQRCDTFHANCVLVPAGPMEAVGGLDPRFRHWHGDTDLGFMLGRQGCAAYVMPDYVGECALNGPLPIAPTVAGRLKARLSPPNSIFDELNMVFKRYPLPVAIGNGALRIAYLFRDALRPRKPPPARK
ncbi:MAG: glycosyltransferase family 2 protein [Sphingomonas bacterium]|uniref:glycosyltransferase family 2 protein n=1 Tax=Sphingomonas bacterium TaxID=1895847 RepID=UPI0026275839|nr:glycosyltransferase family 2 protein [Sphingomonas bacterium]MDB5704244.1 glycosyltransferase family 2 protein [Sphingomonas bacterium]